MKSSSTIGQVFWTAVIFVLLMIPGIYNAFPIVTSDSGTYIGSGLQGWVPIDRPLTYGLFVAFFSFKQSLWYPIIVQNIILAFLLFKIYEHFLAEVKNKMMYFFITLFICTVTGIGWFSAQLMPDIFVGIGFLSLILLLLKPLKKVEKIVLAIFYLLALATHNSHIFIFNLLIFAIAILVLLNVFSIRQLVSAKRLYFMLFLSLFSLLINPSINLIYEGKFKHSGSPYAFLVAKYAENGVLRSYLKDKCVLNISENNHLEQGTYFFKNYSSNLFLDVEGYSMIAGGKIHQWEYTGADNQKFSIEKAQGNNVKIISAKSGLYMTTFTNSEGNLAIRQDQSSNQNNQLFEIISNKKNKEVIVKLKDREAYLASDTSNQAFGMQFMEGNNPNAAYCKFELVSAANCFCFFKDSIPSNAMEFLWHPKSILSRTGNWANHEKDYKFVMHDILFSHQYLGKNAHAALNATLTQLTRNKVGDGISKYDTTSSPYFAIKTSLAASTSPFLLSRENRGELDFVFLNYIIDYLMKISFFVIVLFMAIPHLRKSTSTHLIIFTCISLLMILINAFVTGAMANILDRLQSRISWLLPLIAILIISNWFENKNKDSLV
jgi:hypothetical protein